MQRATITQPITSNRETLQDRFLEVRALSEKLVEPLTADDACVAVTDETSPPKWHLAHSTWFFEHFLLGRDPGYQPLDPAFDFLFNSYYRTVGKFNPKPARRNMARPSFAEVLQYRAAIDERVLALLQSAPEEEVEEIREILTLGWNHEQQHQELLLMDIKRNFFADPTRPAYREQRPLRRVGEGSGISFTSYVGGLFEVGATRGNGFTYDNEHGRHTVWLEPFALAEDLVTNRQFLAFLDDGGYLNPALWLSDGWDWLEQTKARAPLYWERHGSSWQEMTLYGMRELDLDAPVAHVSYYEAQAFARWMQARLPTEFEWEYAAARHELGGQFLEQDHLHPAASASPQLHGRLWQWTQSSYLPYPRYEAPRGPLAEYNGKFFCNQMVLRGGSCITPRSHYRATYRNFYYPHMRWQFAGFRLAKDCPC